MEARERKLFARQLVDIVEMHADGRTDFWPCRVSTKPRLAAARGRQPCSKEEPDNGRPRAWRPFPTASTRTGKSQRCQACGPDLHSCATWYNQYWFAYEQTDHDWTGFRDPWGCGLCTPPLLSVAAARSVTCLGRKHGARPTNTHYGTVSAPHSGRRCGRVTFRHRLQPGDGTSLHVVTAQNAGPGLAEPGVSSLPNQRRS
jgi:hypothetical protein